MMSEADRRGVLLQERFLAEPEVCAGGARRTAPVVDESCSDDAECLG